MYFFPTVKNALSVRANFEHGGYSKHKRNQRLT